MPLPNLLATRAGRLALFTGLYVCEGLPQGFAAVAVPLELKRMGLDALALGSFSALILSPWAWKWAAGPFVDNLRLPWFGRRKQWIVACQALLVVALLVALLAFPARAEGGEIVRLGLFTALVTLTNACSACQDVAIDALAVESLPPSEKGSANGLMFGGAQAGIALGGSGVLFLKEALGFTVASLLVPASVAAILATTVLMLKEPQGAPAAGRTSIGRELFDYVRAVAKAFLGSAQGALGLVLALLPFGGMALSLTVSTIVTPTLGMADDEIASLNLASSLVFVGCCVAGGFLSDRFGRRRTLAVFALGTLLPTLWIASVLDGAGFLHPPAGTAEGTWPRQEALIRAWWVAQLSYTVFQGLMYGIRSAVFMDLADRRIAATHFTAFMAMMNVVTMYSYAWQGAALESWVTVGQVMRFDCLLGALFVLVLPFVRPRAPA